ncbi:MAG: hypothetical protein JCHSAcid_15900 [uncultured Acidilobus sp. JCHS]|nr:MAG: hypothetical protein JCHSAcid_15900 [uncultured Acidilobus sp. JCHS]
MASAPGQAPSPEVERTLGSIRTMVLVALIFAILALIGEIVVLGLVGFAGAVMSEQGIVSPAASAELGFIGFLSVVFLIIDVVVISRTWKMYSAVKNGDIATLKSLNSLGWVISGPDIFWRYTWRIAPHSPREDRGSPKPSGLIP